MNLCTKRNRFTDFGNKFKVTKGESWGEGINSQHRINIHILLYIK